MRSWHGANSPNPGGSPARKEIAILGNIHNNR